MQVWLLGFLTKAKNDGCLKNHCSKIEIELIIQVNIFLKIGA